MSRDRAQWGEVDALVARAASLEFDCALRDLPRVAPLLTREGGNARAVFRFYRLAPAEGAARSFDAAECQVTAILPLTCQRCLGEVQVEVRGQVELAFVADDTLVTEVPESHDSVITEDGRVSFAAVLEEELLLTMPIVPLHADIAQCVPHLPGADEDKPDAEAPAPTQTPFAGLRELMKK